MLQTDLVLLCGHQSRMVGGSRVLLSECVRLLHETCGIASVLIILQGCYSRATPRS